MVAKVCVRWRKRFPAYPPAPAVSKKKNNLFLFDCKRECAWVIPLLDIQIISLLAYRLIVKPKLKLSLARWVRRPLEETPKQIHGNES